MVALGSMRPSDDLGRAPVNRLMPVARPRGKCYRPDSCSKWTNLLEGNPLILPQPISVTRYPCCKYGKSKSPRDRPMAPPFTAGRWRIRLKKQSCFLVMRTPSSNKNQNTFGSHKIVSFGNPELLHKSQKLSQPKVASQSDMILPDDATQKVEGPPFSGGPSGRAARKYGASSLLFHSGCAFRPMRALGRSRNSDNWGMRVAIIHRS